MARLIWMCYINHKYFGTDHFHGNTFVRSLWFFLCTPRVHLPKLQWYSYNFTCMNVPCSSYCIQNFLFVYFAMIVCACDAVYNCVYFRKNMCVHVYGLLIYTLVAFLFLSFLDSNCILLYVNNSLISFCVCIGRRFF